MLHITVGRLMSILQDMSEDKELAITWWEAGDLESRIQEVLDERDDEESDATALADELWPEVVQTFVDEHGDRVVETGNDQLDHAFQSMVDDLLPADTDTEEN
jgi:hypothetical protein